MYFYQLRVDTITDESEHEHTVYGVDIFRRIRSIPDIFFNKHRAKLFVRKCNELQPEPIHMDDIVEDCLLDT